MGCCVLRNALAAALLLLVLLCKDFQATEGGSSSVQGAEFTHMPDNITVLEGDSVTLRCQIDEEVTHKAWLNRSNIMFTGRDKWTLDKRVTLLNNNSSDFSIHISKVQVTDEGPYTCTFQANNKPRLTHVYLIVQVPARIVNISKDVSVNEGENVNLFCLAVGRPEPTVTWKVHKYGLLSDGEFLDITEIKRQQAADYECVTHNGVAPADQSKVKVTVNYPPMITDVKNMPAHVGKTVILRCEAMAVPAATFEWYRDDHRPVESDNNLRVKHEKTRSLLLFSNVTEKHFGNYTCFASNRLGTSNASMLLFRPGAVYGRGSSLQASLNIGVSILVSLSAVHLLKV
ncbi:igLON family member 5 isoform X1 [Eucyclogobius newberryi]|uniref:igLON family member 5 isoform X1 n=1 Tax=Eucyclogobius newberryi TaxID=166745 RepID=UPI003B5CECF2